MRFLVFVFGKNPKGGMGDCVCRCATLKDALDVVWTESSNEHTKFQIFDTHSMDEAMVLNTASDKVVNNIDEEVYKESYFYVS